MRRFSRIAFVLGVALACLSLAGCGSLRGRDTLAKKYVDHCWPDDERVCLTTWPFHVVAISSCFVVDQTLWTFHCVPPAARDAGDYFLMRGSGNNIMLEHTIAVPKALATPAIFVGSFLVRWIAPIGETERVFKQD